MVRLLPSRGVQYGHEATIQTADGVQLRLSRPRLASAFAIYRIPSLRISALGLMLR
jgi:hypothetical protein